MIKHVIAFIFFYCFFVNSNHAQDKPVLKDLMWEMVRDCYENLVENQEQTGKPDLTKAAKMGYYRVHGDTPPCGCLCDVTVGAYTNYDGSYTLLKSDWNDCSQELLLSSNRKLADILPIDFDLQQFIPNYKQGTSDHALFYISVTIPATGTDTRMTIEPLPIGKIINSKNPLPMSYEDYHPHNASSESIFVDIPELKEVVNKLSNEATLDLIISKQFNKITEKDKTAINTLINTDHGKFNSLDEFAGFLSMYKKMHSLYNQMEFSAVILGWDKKVSRFYIKSKEKSTRAKQTFKNFLITSRYYVVKC